MVLAALFAACASAEAAYYSSTGEESQLPYTETFAPLDLPEQPLTETSMVGLILGFVTVGIFLIYANIKVCLDEKKRHAQFESDIAEAELSLQKDYGTSPEELQQIKDEFVQMESGQLKEKNADDDDMADIN